jgi:hypothetical protein
MLYQINITSKDHLGLNMIENIVEMANKGAVLKPGAMPIMNFPHSCTMLIDSDTPPTPNAFIRVFEVDSKKEVLPSTSEPEVKVPTEPATFSMENSDEHKPLTREELDKLDFQTEFKDLCKSVGITGRDREKMTKEYFAKFE